MYYESYYAYCFFILVWQVGAQSIGNFTECLKYEKMNWSMDLWLRSVRLVNDLGTSTIIFSILIITMNSHGLTYIFNLPDEPERHFFLPAPRTMV